MKLVKSLAVATLVMGMASAQQQPNQADWAKHVQQAKARTRAYVDSGALDERKKAVHDRVGSIQHRALEDAEDGDVDGNRHLQTMDNTRVVDGRFRSGTKGVRENAKLRRKRMYSNGMWLIGRRVYRDYPHLMAGEEGEEGVDYDYEYEPEEAYEADGDEAEDGAIPGQRALYSSDKFDSRKDTYQARADAHVSNAQNHAEFSKERAKSSGWYPDQEAEAEGEEAPEQNKEAANSDEAEDGAVPSQRALYSSDKFDARKESYQGRADAHVSNAKNRKEMSKERAKNSGWYPDQEAEAEAEAEEEAPAEPEQKEAVAEEGSDLSQASEMAGFDITDPTTKMTYVGKGAAYAASGVSRAVGRGATVAEREVDFASSRAELAYKNRQDNLKGRKLRGGRA